MTTHASLQETLNYYFDDTALLDEATLAAGASASYRPGNKRLALIGDALIRLDVAHRSYINNRGTKESSDILKEAGANTALEDLGRRLGLNEHITKNPAQRGEIPRATLASTVEALIGAVWVDSGSDFGQAQAVIRHLEITEPFEGGGTG